MYFMIGPSYNQPKFCPSATWNLNATTFANVSTVGATPYGIYIDTNNSVYVTEQALQQVQVWSEGSMIPTRNISGGLLNPYGIFVTDNGDVYVDNGASNSRVDKWTINAANSTIAMYVNGRCYSLFVDVYNNIYCSLDNFHKVVQKSFYDDANISTIVAGNTVAGNTSYMLNSPRGIFVDLNLNLYVADYANNRIQLFKSSQSNATTVAGSSANGTIALNGPTGITLDADGYLFIVDSASSRIIGSGPDGFRCLVACEFINGPAVNQLDSPSSLSFDNYGNLFVVDTSNSRIQKFFLEINTCGKSDNIFIEIKYYITFTAVQVLQNS
jgi:streptogramin lyase